MSGYASIIKAIDPMADADVVECFMRLQYGTLDHLDRDVFRREIQMCALLTDAERELVKSSYRNAPRLPNTGTRQ